MIEQAQSLLKATMQETRALASHNRCSENVRIVTIIISELELGNIEGQVLFADLMKGPDAPSLDEGPKPFDGLRVDRT